MGTTDEGRSDIGSVPLCHDASALARKVQNPKSNTGAKELGFGALGDATLVVIEEIIETAEGKEEEEKKKEEVLKKVMTRKK